MTIDHCDRNIYVYYKVKLYATIHEEPNNSISTDHSRQLLITQWPFHGLLSLLEEELHRKPGPTAE